MREVEVVGVRVEMPTNQPLVLLRDAEGARYLPIWIGAVEASAIAYAQQGTPTVRPLTHELMQHVVEALGDELDEVRALLTTSGSRAFVEELAEQHLALARSGVAELGIPLDLLEAVTVRQLTVVDGREVAA